MQGSESAIKAPAITVTDFCGFQRLKTPVLNMASFDTFLDRLAAHSTHPSKAAYANSILMKISFIALDINIEENKMDKLINKSSSLVFLTTLFASAHSGHQLDSEKIAQTEDHLILAVGVGMECVRLNLSSIK